LESRCGRDRNKDHQPCRRIAHCFRPECLDRQAMSNLHEDRKIVAIMKVTHRLVSHGLQQTKYIATRDLP
jgi:hypothetical protein